MSLELSGTNPMIMAVSGMPGTNTIKLYDNQNEMEIPMEDFCSLVEYALTNTDLLPDDPRYKLMYKIREKALVVEGYNPDSFRIAFP